MSWSFWTAMLVLLGVVVGPWLPNKTRRLVFSSVATVGTLMVIGILSVSGSNEQAFLREARIPTGEPLSRWTSLFAERDTALLAMPFVTTRNERFGLTHALDAVYDELEADAIVRRTTQFRTVFGCHSGEASDAHVHEEDDGRKWVIFLHGLGGNTVSGCWVIAKAASRSGWSTICPSTSLDGRWGQREGPQVVHEAVTFARSRGAERLVLAGYSNGASGALQILTESEASNFVVLPPHDPNTSFITVRFVSRSAPEVWSSRDFGPIP